MDAPRGGVEQGSGMTVETAVPRSSAWKWALAAAAAGIVMKLAMDWLWLHTSRYNLLFSQIYELADALLVPVNFVWLILPRVIGGNLPSVISDYYLYEAANGVIYALFGYLLWRVRARGWLGYGVFGSTLAVFWGALVGLAMLAGVTTGHGDGIYERIIPAKLSHDIVQQIQDKAISAAELTALAGEPDCMIEKEGRQIFVYRALTQRRYVDYLFFITTKVGYVTRQRLDFIWSENGAIVQRMDSAEIYEGKAEDLAFDCDSLALE